jgi:hypothetical protein
MAQSLGKGKTCKCFSNCLAVADCLIEMCGMIGKYFGKDLATGFSSGGRGESENSFTDYASNTR